MKARELRLHDIITVDGVVLQVQSLKSLHVPGALFVCVEVTGARYGGRGLVTFTLQNTEAVELYAPAT